MSILVETNKHGMDYAQGIPPSNPVRYMTWLDTSNSSNCLHKIYTGSRWINLDLKYNGDKGIFGGGNTGSYVNTIEQVTISSSGNATDFGDLTESKRYPSATSNG